MQLSPSGIELLKKLEGYKDKSYQDGAGVWTLGYGTTHGIKVGMTCTPVMAEGWLIRDTAAADTAVTKMVHAPRTQNEHDALVIFAYNVGVPSLASSTLLRKFNAGDKAGAAEQFKAWNKIRVNGQLAESKGLLSRRLAEMNLFLGAVS